MLYLILSMNYHVFKLIIINHNNFHQISLIMMKIFIIFIIIIYQFKNKFSVNKNILVFENGFEVRFHLIIG